MNSIYQHIDALANAAHQEIRRMSERALLEIQHRTEHHIRSMAQSRRHWKAARRML